MRRPVLVPVLDCLLDRLALRPAREIDHRGGAPVERRAAHDRRRICVRDTAVRMRRVPFQMHMRIDAARHHEVAHEQAAPGEAGSPCANDLP